jgi:hypothetical protein
MLLEGCSTTSVIIFSPCLLLLQCNKQHETNMSDQYPPLPGPDGRFVPTGLSFHSEYDHANHPEVITIKRKDLELCLRTAIEESMCWGGAVTTIACKYMQDMDRLAAGEISSGV